MKCTYALVSFLLIAGLPGFSQYKDSVESSAGKGKAIEFYNKAMDVQRGLYNGLEYDPYPVFVKGSPNFMDQKDWVKGELVYNGFLFSNIPMKYDLVKDQLVILDTNTNISILLNNESIRHFKLQNHHFEYIRPELPGKITSGFYELLCEGKFRLYSKRIRMIKNTRSLASDLEKTFYENQNYYVEEDGNYTRLASRNGFLKYFKEKRDEIVNYLRNEGIDYSDDKEAYMVKGIMYYNSLK